MLVRCYKFKVSTTITLILEVVTIFRLYFLHCAFLARDAYGVSYLVRAFVVMVNFA